MFFPSSKRNPKIHIRKAFTKNPVFIDGMGRSGKVVINIAVSSLERAEHIQGRPMLDSRPVKKRS